MQAVLLEDGRVQVRTDYPYPKPQENEALIRVLLAGVCATDLEIVKGYAGFDGVMGHEFVGVVVEAQDKMWVGKRVTGSINIGCARCPTCLAHGPEHCPDRTVLGIIGKDGAFADYITLPLTNLHVVPKDIADEEAVFTEPLAAAVRISEQVNVRPTALTGVVGPGRLGLLIGQVLALNGTQVTMLGRSDTSLDLPRQLGLQTALVDDVADNTYELVVEATGNEKGLAQALRLVQPLGTLVMKSTFQGAANVDLTKLVVGEINVVGSRCGPFAPALRLLRKQAINVRSLVEAEYPLPQVGEALEHAARPGVRKVLLRP